MNEILSTLHIIFNTNPQSDLVTTNRCFNIYIYIYIYIIYIYIYIYHTRFFVGYFLSSRIPNSPVPHTHILFYSFVCLFFQHALFIYLFFNLYLNISIRHTRSENPESANKIHYAVQMPPWRKENWKPTQKTEFMAQNQFV